MKILSVQFIVLSRLGAESDKCAVNISPRLLNNRSIGNDFLLHVGSFSML